MEKDLDPDIIKATQVSLGKYVKKPPLSEKLLKKPPFRFLHDVITSVLKATGFFENLFDEEELISENVKDRENKISFLNKVIFVVSTTTGKTLSVKSSKIVAGQEPEKTNELLQVLAHALDKKLTSDDAVKKYKESIKISKTTEIKNKDPAKVSKKVNDSKKLTAKSNEKLTSQKSEVSVRATTKQDKDKFNDSKSKKRDIIATKSESQKKSQPKLDIRKSVADKGLKKDNRDGSSDRNAKSITNNKQKRQVPESPNQERMPLEETTKSSINTSEDTHIGTASNGQESVKSSELNENNLNDSYTIGENGLDSSASSQDLLEVVNVVEGSNKSVELVMNSVIASDDNLQTQSKIFQQGVNENNEEPSNEDQIPNNVLSNKTEKVQGFESNNKITGPRDNSAKPVVRPLSVRPSSSRPGAPRMRDKLDNVLKEPDNLLLGKVNIIIENTQNDEEDDSSLIIVNSQGEDSTLEDSPELQTSSNEHGHLVQQILQSHKELSQATGKTEIEWQFGAQKAREAVNQEIEQLRFSIQALSRVTNPLGKLFDHIQEDVEVMRQELQQWTTIYEDVTKEMNKQKTLNEDSLIPLHTKLKQLDGDIDEKRDKINDLKVLIHKNASRIEKLLASGTMQ